MNNGNASISRDVDIGVNHGWNSRTDSRRRCVGTATAAAVGPVAWSLPPACAVVVENATQYNYCVGVYYQPMYSGSTVSCVVVNP